MLPSRKIGTNLLQNKHKEHKNEYLEVGGKVLNMVLLYTLRNERNVERFRKTESVELVLISKRSQSVFQSMQGY